MADKILQMFFEPERWANALEKGVVKGISTAVLRELMSPAGRLKLMAMIHTHKYHIKRPYTAKIPKDTPGEYRIVFVNDGIDRVTLSLTNDLLFDIAGDMVHPQCTSYQKGIGCAKIVTKASRMIEQLSGPDHKVMGWKSDLSKYFDSVPIRFIDKAFDAVVERYGESKIIDIVREYYHNDRYYDSEMQQECVKYQSLKQGCAVASWLADVVLYHIDQRISSECNGYYVRYSDDTLYIGEDYEKAMEIMVTELGKMEMRLNPKKVEYLTNDRWFKFLGYSIRGASISLSQGRIKNFAKEIKSRTIGKIREGISYAKALHSVQNWMYYGDGEHSWASGVLKTINVESDINTLNGFVMDCLRAVRVGKPVKPHHIGGLGWVRDNPSGCVNRGKGSKVRTLRTKTERLEGYYSIGCMRKNLLFSKDLYDTIVRGM